MVSSGDGQNAFVFALPWKSVHILNENLEETHESIQLIQEKRAYARTDHGVEVFKDKNTRCVSPCMGEDATNTVLGAHLRRKGLDI